MNGWTQSAALVLIAGKKKNYSWRRLKPGGKQRLLWGLVVDRKLIPASPLTCEINIFVSILIGGRPVSRGGAGGAVLDSFQGRVLADGVTLHDLSVHRSLSVNPTVSFCLSADLSLSVCLSADLSLSVCLSTDLSLSVLSVCLPHSVRLSLSVHGSLSVYPPVAFCLSRDLFLSVRLVYLTCPPPHPPLSCLPPTPPISLYVVCLSFASFCL